jgi:hypothetical protein
MESLSTDQVGCSMPRGEALKAALEALRSAIPELKGVLLASNEGLPIAHALTNGTDPNRLAAMSAAASTLGRRIGETMSVGKIPPRRRKESPRRPESKLKPC